MRIHESAEKFVAFDTETHLTQPETPIPRMVCASFAFANGRASFLSKDRAEIRIEFENLLDTDAIIVGANIAFDMLVCLRAWPELLHKIYAKYERQEVYDIQIAQTLDAIAKGCLFQDPITKQPLRRKDGKPGRYSLDICVQQVLGRRDAKENDFWRKRYAALEKIPLDLWPWMAKQYPIDDVENTLKVALAQVNHENLHDLPDQTYTSFVMQRGSAWGFAVDPQYIADLKLKASEIYAKGLEPFKSLGFIRPDGVEDGPTLKRLVIESYTGKSVSCTFCTKGKVPSPKTPKKQINCKKCSGTGLWVGTNVPVTPTGGVSASRDTLSESGHEDLMAYAAFGEQSKILETYIPFLESGKAGFVSLRPNVLVATGRTSYDGVIQLLPRKGGVREAFVARPGKVLCSSDYTGMELATHAQSVYDMIGWSKLRDALNAKVEVHSAMGATLCGVTYDEFLKRKKELKNFRQAAKAANFGFPGGMGALKLVQQQRVQGPDTTAENGLVYKGLRFCVLLEGAKACGEVKITEYKEKPTSPVCKRCVQIAEDIRQKWFQQWPENREYLRLVSRIVEEHGFVIQHRSKRKRGGVHFTDAANGFFQGLGADGFKRAARLASFEMDTMGNSPLYRSKILLLAHDELLVEMDELASDLAAKRLREIMVAGMKEYLPDVEIDAEPCLMRRWYKGAEPVFDANGKLIPWEPT